MNQQIYNLDDNYDCEQDIYQKFKLDVKDIFAPNSQSIFQDVDEIKNYNNQLNKDLNQQLNKQEQQKDNEYLIKFKIQEQMKKYQAKKNSIQNLEQKDKNQIKLQVWDQLFGQKKDQVQTQIQKEYQQYKKNQSQHNNSDQNLKQADKEQITTDQISQYIAEQLLISQNNQQINTLQNTQNQNQSISKRVFGIKDQSIIKQQQNEQDQVKDNSQIQLKSILINPSQIQSISSNLSTNSQFQNKLNYSNDVIQNNSQNYSQKSNIDDISVFSNFKLVQDKKNDRLSQNDENNQSIQVENQSMIEARVIINDSKQVNNKLQNSLNILGQQFDSSEIQSNIQKSFHSSNNSNYSIKQFQKKDKSIEKNKKTHADFSENYNHPQTYNINKSQQSSNQILQSQYSQQPSLSNISENKLVCVDLLEKEQQQFINSKIVKRDEINQRQDQNQGEVFEQKKDFLKTSKFDTCFLGNQHAIEYRISQSQINDDDDGVQDNFEDGEDLNNRSQEIIFDLQQDKSLEEIQEVEESHFEQRSINFLQNQFQVEQINFIDQKPEIDINLQNKNDPKKNVFISYDIELDENEQVSKKQKYDALRQKKIEEMDQAKLERQKRRQAWDESQVDSEVNSSSLPRTPNRERSPVMPSAKIQVKSKSKIEDGEKIISKDHGLPKGQSQKVTLKKSENIFQKEQNQPQVNNRMNQRLIKQTNQKDDSFSLEQSDQNIQIFNNNNNNNKLRNTSTNSKQRTDNQILPIPKKNNKQILKNAINNICLAGEPNKKEREYVISQIEQCEAEHFIILLKGSYGRTDFRAFYQMSSSDPRPQLIFSLHKSPNFLDSEEVISYFKYDSGSKEFKIIPGVKSFSFAIDAVKYKK